MSADLTTSPRPWQRHTWIRSCEAWIRKTRKVKARNQRRTCATRRSTRENHAKKKNMIKNRERYEWSFRYRFHEDPYGSSYFHHDPSFLIGGKCTRAAPLRWFRSKLQFYSILQFACDISNWRIKREFNDLTWRRHALTFEVRCWCYRFASEAAGASTPLGKKMQKDATRGDSGWSSRKFKRLQQFGTCHFRPETLRECWIRKVSQLAWK